MADTFTPPSLDSHQGPVPGFTPPSLESHQGPASDTAVRDQLKSQGFLDSAWTALKSPFTAMAGLFNGDYRKQHEADYARMEELQKNGTPEQKREFAKEVLLKHIPLASTIYKAAQGNIAGAAGDVAGLAVLGGAARAAESPVVGTAVKGALSGAVEAAPAAAEASVLRYTGVPRLIRGAIEGVRAARGGGVVREPGTGTTAPLGGGYIKYGPEVPPDPQAPAPVAVTETPGQSLARSIGSDWEKLSTDDRMTLEIAAKSQQNAKATPPPPVATQPAPPPVAAQPAPAPAQNFTIQELLQQEMAARQSQAAPAPAAVSGPMIGAHDTTPLQAGKAPPLRPPMAQAPQPPEQPPQPVSPAPTQAPMPPPKPSMAQLEAWMAQKKPAPLPSAQSSYNPDGSRMSPQMRGAVVKGANVTAKAQRYAQALFDEGITHEDVSNMTASDRAVVNQGLIAKGRLEPGENPPDESRPLIIWNLKKLQAAKYAADLKAEMEASGTLAK